MKSAYLYKSSLVIRIALGTAILLIVYITVVFFNQMQNLGKSVHSMSTSNRKLIELEEILTILAINESSVRSFVITGDSTYLDKRFRPKSEIIPQIEKLRVLTTQSPSKTFSCDTLSVMIDRRFVLFKDALAKASVQQPLPNAELNLVLSKSDTVSDIIRKYIYGSMEDEASNVHRYEINHRYEIETSILTSFLLVTVALFILLLSLNRISGDLRNLKKLNDDLQFLNYTFNNAEKIAGISHWKYNLQTHKYSFSDNFYNLLAIDRESFEPSMENVLPYLHPDDRDYVINAYTDSIQNKTPTSLVYRLYRKNGEMRYIKSIGSFAENSKGEIVKIGVNYDITEQYQKTMELEENNRNLIAINSELESFNNIVSHDLQEPLRKIQMFISRIDDDEKASLSERGKDYFNRIAASANRMQNLLIDLVNYSRTMKGDLTFESADLDKIVSDVLNDLEVNIEEKNAKITVGKLPKIDGIPFQLHQLFINLVTNSLKFTKEGRFPEIKIYAEKIKKGETTRDFSPDAKSHHKIIVEDNGIGFRQEFADKIFMLFRRLEKETFQGTGIGLAICKRIVENHNGHIIAEGTPDQGARFIMCFPVAEIKNDNYKKSGS